MKKFNNIFLKNTSEKMEYISKTLGFGDKNIPSRDIKTHGNFIKEKLRKLLIDNPLKTPMIKTQHGIYLEFESSPSYDLKTKSLESKQAGIKLLNIRHENKVTKATVFIPKGKENYFLNKVNQYLESSEEKIKNADLINSIEKINLAVLESFWIGNKEWIPKENKGWCEVWIRVENEEDTSIEEFKTWVKAKKLQIRPESLDFPERKVFLIKVDNLDLKNMILSLSNISEIRRAVETSTFFLDMPNNEQVEWAKDLRKRIIKKDNISTKISILDTGVRNTHILLSDFLNDKDCFVYSNWDIDDIDGHGTAMAGLALYCDLQYYLESSENLLLEHELESFKILPEKGENEPKLYGAITSEAISELIIENAFTKRIICMAITAPAYQTDDGSPSSWSAAIDSITSGYVDEIKKLMFISGGNVPKENLINYPEINLIESIQNPGQSWNAITVGAFTEKDKIDTNKYGELTALAKKGELSPYSTTSVSWSSKWPIKPEIVLEGGNVLKDSIDTYSREDDFSLLTTYNKTRDRQFTNICATSAATAQAANYAARIQVKYPKAWPETIRALLIHSADWTKEMKDQFLNSELKNSYKKLLRTCGYGVPNLEKALMCKNNHVNLIIESELSPIKKEKSKYKNKEMEIHEIPWPKEELLKLGDVEVEMKVTLSYFIEPSPGEVGWKDKYRYPSCGLRFEVNNGESRENFIKIISKVMNEDEAMDLPTIKNSINWTLGVKNRNVGSIHSDIWKGTAAELSDSNLLAVYPTIGWWKERHHLGRWNKSIRYSLIVSISTPVMGVDLYTPIISIIESKAKILVEV